ncbi:MAG TPA: hypothetical protein VFV67_07385 [Actinophytocola sp.]|uniref:hypothetical protein n=1 Tax=Actinophytocola sp. TaxID=1872138 RepID=UPI002DBFBDB8|nr:hypothetical protein [Actinophytocola sp.]HEU5470459.1 hypothetical protein [Actinophytocola sp.]
MGEAVWLNGPVGAGSEHRVLLLGLRTVVVVVVFTVPPGLSGVAPGGAAMDGADAMPGSAAGDGAAVHNSVAGAELGTTVQAGVIHGGVHVHVTRRGS